MDSVFVYIYCRPTSEIPKYRPFAYCNTGMCTEYPRLLVSDDKLLLGRVKKYKRFL